MAENDTDYLPYVLGAAGAAGGGLLGRKLAGKTGKPAKGGGKTAKQLRSDRMRTAGAALGGVSGVGLGKAASDPETVREDINRALRARDAVVNALSNDGDGNAIKAAIGYGVGVPFLARSLGGSVKVLRKSAKELRKASEGKKFKGDVNFQKTFKPIVRDGAIGAAGLAYGASNMPKRKATADEYFVPYAPLRNP